MSGGQYPSWFAAVATAVTMLFLGVRTRLLARPQLRVRCGACRRLVRKGRTCPCAVKSA
jgi:hypothetical protein